MLLLSHTMCKENIVKQIKVEFLTEISVSQSPDTKSVDTKMYVCIYVVPKPII